MTAFENRIQEIGAAAEVLLPEGPGPFPVLLQLHGCGGRGQNQRRWAEVVRAQGVAACILDSFAFRNIRRAEALATVCTGLRLWGRERAGDLYAGMAWVRRQPWADARRIAAAGWSHGGWSVLEAMALSSDQRSSCTGLAPLPPEPLAGLCGAFVIYPYLGRAALAPRVGLNHRSPVCAIVGGRDRTVGARTPLAALSALQARGCDVRVHVFETATHDFDEPCVEGGLRSPGSRYDPALTRKAEALLGHFLEEVLRSGPRAPP